MMADLSTCSSKSWYLFNHVALAIQEKKPRQVDAKFWLMQPFGYIHNLIEIAIRSDGKIWVVEQHMLDSMAKYAQ